MSEQVRQCSDAGYDKTSCENCSQANAAPDFSAPLHEMSTVKKLSVLSAARAASANLLSQHF